MTSSSVMVPLTFTLKYSSGRSIDSPTSDRAAKWTTPSIRRVRKRASSAFRSRISPSTRALPNARSRWPRLMSSKTTTLCPASMRARLTVLPIYPAPPVTRIMRPSPSVPVRCGPFSREAAATKRRRGSCRYDTHQSYGRRSDPAMERRTNSGPAGASGSRNPARVAVE